MTKVDNKDNKNNNIANEHESDFIKISMFVALIVVLSQVYMPAIINEVPISLGVLGIYITALQLTPKNTVLVIVIYIFLGILGLPVFVGHKSGLEAILGPTGGYILSYPLVGYIVSYVKQQTTNTSTLYLGFGVALLWCYSLGSLRLAYVMDIGFVKALVLGVVPYIVGDILKIIAAFYISRYFSKIIIADY